MEEINSKLENGVLVIDNFEAVKNNVLEFISEPKFNEAKCKEIEKILKDKSAEIGDKLKAYKEAKEPENKMKIYTIEVKTADINLIAKIKTLCEKANCEINFKEE